MKKKYKPTIEELEELGFSTENTTGDDHFMCSLGSGEYIGFVLPELFSYFSEGNVFLFKNKYLKPKSFEEFKTLINDLKTKYK
jgi:hypothetical protein